MRTASSTLRTKIFPSPILPVPAAVLIASTAAAACGVVDDRFQLHLRHEVHLVLGAAVDFGLALLPAVALDFRDRQALDARGHEGFADLVELEGFDDSP